MNFDDEIRFTKNGLKGRFDDPDIQTRPDRYQVERAQGIERDRIYKRAPGGQGCTYLWWRSFNHGR